MDSESTQRQRSETSSRRRWRFRKKESSLCPPVSGQALAVNGRRHSRPADSRFSSVTWEEVMPEIVAAFGRPGMIAGRLRSYSINPVRISLIFIKFHIQACTLVPRARSRIIVGGLNSGYIKGKIFGQCLAVGGVEHAQIKTNTATFWDCLGRPIRRNIINREFN